MNLRARGRPRLAALVDHPIQHFSPAFRLVEARPALEALVLYWNANERGYFDPDFNRKIEWDVDLLSGYRWAAAPTAATFATKASATLRTLRQFDPDVVLAFGWTTPIARLGVAWAIAAGRHLLLYGDSTWQHEPRGLRGVVRRTVFRRLIGVSAGALSTGTFNREFYIRHGMHPSDITASVYPVDLALYGSAAPASTETLGDDRMRIGFAGKLLPTKGASDFLLALSLLDEALWRDAVIAGDGPLRRNLEELADELGIAARVSFLGFVNQSAMPAVLASCGIVVVPSRMDRRVLVVAEAMASGAAVVASSNTAVWGPGDLLEHGESGLVHRAGDPVDLANKLSYALSDHSLVEDLSREGARRVQSYGPDAFAASLEAAVDGLIG